MKVIKKRDRHIFRTGYGTFGIAFGSIFVLVGLPFALFGLGAVEMGGANAPPWVIGSMGLAFSMAGGLFVGHGLQGWLNTRRQERSVARHPGKPWFADYPWEPAGIADRPHGRWLYQLYSLVFVTCFMAPFNWWAFLSKDGTLMVQAVTGIFDLVILAMLLNGLYLLAQALKFRRARLRFDQFPYRPGGELALTFAPNDYEHLRCTLRYVEERFEEHGDSKRAIAYQRHAQTQELDPDPHLDAMPLRFQLPDDPDMITELTANPHVRYWELLVESRMPGINYKASFPLPVYEPY